MIHQRHDLSRRAFLRHALVGGGMLLMGWPRRLAWAMAPAPGADSLKVLFFTDVHARVEWGTPEAMRRAAAAMNARRADLVLCGGDMITDGYTATSASITPRWQAWRAMHDALRPTPVCAVGNHDLVGVAPADGTAPADDPRADVRAWMAMPQTWRSFDRNGYHFILLDAMEVVAGPLKYRGWVNAAQMRWLRADLDAVGRDTPIIVVTHMPLLTGFFQMTEGFESPAPANRGVVNNREVLTAFEGRRLLAVLQGHMHVNEMLRWRDTTFITGGAVCGKWWRGAWHGTNPGFGELRLHPDRVEWEYHTYPWQPRRPRDE